MVTALWGTGSSAQAAVEILGLKPSRVFSTDQEAGYFLGVRVEPIENIRKNPEEITELYICTMFYREALSDLTNWGLEITQVRVFHSHLLHPMYRLNEVINVGSLDQSPDFSAVLAPSETPEAVNFPDRLDHLDFAFKKAPGTGLVAEFGVFRGETLLRLQTQTHRLVYGFDSNRGFNASWQEGIKFYGYAELPTELLNHPGFVVGWFQETLPLFLEENTNQFAFIHYDAGDLDTARFVFRLVLPRIADRAVLVCDELLACDSLGETRSPEHVALMECAKEFGLSFDWLGRSGTAGSIVFSKKS